MSKQLQQITPPSAVELVDTINEASGRLSWVAQELADNTANDDEWRNRIVLEQVEHVRELLEAAAKQYEDAQDAAQREVA
jgi:hypothetical protein